MAGNEVPTDTIGETENYVAWYSEDEGERAYHVELGNVTLHFFREEWLELLSLVERVPKDGVQADPLAETDNYVIYLETDEDDTVLTYLELSGVILNFEPDEWDEFLALLEEAATNT